ncbi:unnamed protein product [Blepharisma stoltei]|uniref:Protein kinase domain-containing protein n=1 Tax=Blepharisma stoltei TaxID=1481888 RepID=A0AAU9K0V9_9CILI|nr:unnamed protein product [Blepharisma stoltei]
MEIIKSPTKKIPVLPSLNSIRYRCSSAIRIASKHIAISPERPTKRKVADNDLYPNSPNKPISPIMNKSVEEFHPSYSIKDLYLGKCLGRGKQGRVVHATLRNKEFAVKILHKDEKKTGEMEWKILNRLKSPFLVHSYGKIMDSDNMYLLLELMDGGDLFHLIRKRKLNIKEITFISAEIVLAVEHLHNQGVIYRDLKPENVMLDASGHIKLVDFGLSKIIDDDRAQTACGSAEYMAPEIIRRQLYTYSADWWSFGVLVYELFHGHTPFRGESNKEVYQNILRGDIIYSRSLDATSKDFIRSLLNLESEYRLGSLENGICDIKNHPFFRKIDWRVIPERLQSPLREHQICKI